MKILLAACTIAAVGLAGCADAPGVGSSSGLPSGSEAAGFAKGTGWIGSEPLGLDELRGQVVLVDFWTYSCINCIRTLPHLTSWYEAYEDHGFVIVGVHSPEFDFEKDRQNVIDAMDRFGIHYPVVQDNDFGIWRDYSNRFWPAKYLIDADGMVRYTHFGEGAYKTTEEHIRGLLADAGATDLPPPVEGVSGTGTRGTDVTPELYLGTWRQDWTIGNPEGYQDGEVVSYSLPADRQRDRVYLHGDWFNGEEAMVARSEGSVVLRFAAGAANIVADGPPSSCVEVRLDRVPIPSELAGGDVDASRSPPCLWLQDTPRSYDFYAGAVEEHEVRFEVPEGFALYTFAFSSYPGA